VYNRWLLFDSRVFWFTGQSRESWWDESVSSSSSSVWRFVCVTLSWFWWWSSLVNDSVNENCVLSQRLLWLRASVVAPTPGIRSSASTIAVCYNRRPHLVIPWRVCFRFSVCVCFLLVFFCIWVFKLIWGCVWLKVQLLIRVLLFQWTWMKTLLRVEMRYRSNAWRTLIASCIYVHRLLFLHFFVLIFALKCCTYIYWNFPCYS